MSIRRACAVFALLVLAVAAQTADATRPLPPFYPPSPAAASYDAQRFVRAREAQLAWQGATFSEGTLSERVPLNGEWRFSGLERSATPFAEDADLASGIQAPGFADRGWGTIIVPSDFYLKFPSEVTAPYAKAWYRTVLDIPASAAGKRVILHFGVIGYAARLFIAGQEIGSHHGDFTPWDVDITAAVTPGAKAVLALRVFSDLGPNREVSGGKLITTATHAYGCQYAKPCIKGGLWQPVELRIEPAVRIERAFIDPDLKDSSIAVRCEVVNTTGEERAFDLLGAVRDALAVAPAPDAAAPARLARISVKPGVSTIALRIPLHDPKSWTLESPQLYNLVLALSADGAVVAAKGERFGYRSFTTEGDHFLLNGKRTYLFGESLIIESLLAKQGKPELDQPDISLAARSKLADLLLGFRARGSMMVRTSEQPPVPAFYEVADEVGMLIYDMWAWSYNNKPAPSFADNNLTEVAEWLRRDYNHPSVAAWLGGNEVVLTDECAALFARQTRLIRDFERGGRPVSAFSGLAARNYNQGMRLDTDLLDLHSYVGLNADPWTAWEEVFNRSYTQAVGAFAQDGKPFAGPFVVWELVGFSWGRRTAAYQPGEVDTYLKWAKEPTSWGQPNAIGWAGSIGLAAALAPDSAERGMVAIGRRIMEYVRQDTRVSGFAPWFLQASITLPATSLWTQPVYCGLRDAAGLPLRNVFAGQAYRQAMFVINSTDVPRPGHRLRITLAEADGSEVLLSEQVIDATPWKHVTGEVELTFPAGAAARWAQLRVRVLDCNGAEASRNFYDVFIQERTAVIAPLPAPAEVGVIACQASGEERLRGILATLHVTTRDIADPATLDAVRVAVLPPSATAPVLSGELQRALTAWVRRGGTLLVLEQSWDGDFALLSKTLNAAPALFADVVMPAHPLFAGLSQANFEFWNGAARGQTATHGFGALSEGVLVARAPRLGQRDSYELVCEGRLDQGRILASQLTACALWEVDSAATTYLRNVLAYSLAKPTAPVRAWSEHSHAYPVAQQAELVPIDLRRYANMGFKDEVAGDGHGGWTDQGDNDFRMMPLGRQVIRGVACEIIDPATNDGRSCIVVKDKPTGDFRDAVSGIAVNERMLRLFFVHAEAYADVGESLLYRIHYADGQTLDLPTVHDATIADWWYTSELSGARIALTRANARGQAVGLQIMEWVNPRPAVAIAALDIIAPRNRPVVSMVVAITGEKATVPALPLSGGAWSRVAAEPTGGVVKSGPQISSVTPVPADGADAIAVAMPAHRSDEAQPVVFTRFCSAAQAAQLTGPYRYLVLELKGRSGGDLEAVLPDEGWTSKSFRAEVPIGIDGAYRLVRIPLDGLLFPLHDLRGEVYLYARTQGRALAFQVRHVRLE